MWDKSVLVGLFIGAAVTASAAARQPAGGYHTDPSCYDWVMETTLEEDLQLLQAGDVRALECRLSSNRDNEVGYEMRYALYVRTGVMPEDLPALTAEKTRSKVISRVRFAHLHLDFLGPPSEWDYRRLCYPMTPEGAELVEMARRDPPETRDFGHPCPEPMQIDRFWRNDDPGGSGIGHR